MIKRLSYDFLLDRFSQRDVYMNVININDDLLKIILQSLNDKKRIDFLKVFAEHIVNKDKKFIFIFKILNIQTMI